MAAFHHTPDNTIRIAEGGRALYQATLSLFQFHAMALNLPAYAGLAEGQRERRYYGERHIIGTADSQEVGETPWADGDAYLAAAEALAELLTSEEPGATPTGSIRVITALTFRRRLSAERRAAITMAASMAMDAGDATLQVFLDDLAAAGKVELDGIETIAGVAAMLAAGLITSGEAVALRADGTADEAA